MAKYQLKKDYSFIEYLPNTNKVRTVVAGEAIIELTDKQYASCGQQHKLIKLDADASKQDSDEEEKTDGDESNTGNEVPDPAIEITATASALGTASFQNKDKLAQVKASLKGK